MGFQRRSNGLDLGRTSWSGGSYAETRLTAARAGYNLYRPHTFLTWVYMASTAVPNFTYTPFLRFDGPTGTTGLGMTHNSSANVRRIQAAQDYAGANKQRISANSTLVSNTTMFLGSRNTDPHSSAGNTINIYKGDLTTAATETGYFSTTDGTTGPVDDGDMRLIMGANLGASDFWAGDVYYSQLVMASLSQAEIQRCQFDLNYALKLGEKHGGGLWLPGTNGTKIIRDLIGDNHFDVFGGADLQNTIAPVKRFKYPLPRSRSVAFVSASVHNLTPTDIASASEISAPVLGQIHTFTATDIESAAEVSTPALASVHILAPLDVESGSEVTTPALGQIHALGVNDVESSGEVSSPVVGQMHVLTPVSIESASEVSTPVLSVAAHALFADDIEAASEISTPAIGQIHVLVADNSESASEITTPALGQIHVLTPNAIESSGEVSTPALGIAATFDPRITIAGAPAGPAIVTGSPAGPAVITGSPAGPVTITGDAELDPTHIDVFYFGEPIELKKLAKAPGGLAIIASPASQVLKIAISKTKGGAAILDFDDKYTLVDEPTGEFSIVLDAADYDTVLVEGRTYYYTLWSQAGADDPRIQGWGTIALDAAIAAA